MQFTVLSSHSKVSSLFSFNATVDIVNQLAKISLPMAGQHTSHQKTSIYVDQHQHQQEEEGGSRINFSFTCCVENMFCYRSLTGSRTPSPQPYPWPMLWILIFITTCLDVSVTMLLLPLWPVAVIAVLVNTSAYSSMKGARSDKRIFPPIFPTKLFFRRILIAIVVICSLCPRFPLSRWSGDTESSTGPFARLGLPAVSRPWEFISVLHPNPRRLSGAVVLYDDYYNGRNEQIIPERVEEDTPSFV